MGSRRLLWVVVVACALPAFTALAQVSGGFHAVVRVTGIADRDLLERIRGQLADIAISLVVVDTEPLEPSINDQITHADRLANQQGQDVVVWFERSPNYVRVFISETKSGRLLVRTITVTSDGVSPALEGAALIVRGGLRALSEGGSIGIDRSTAISPSAAPSVSVSGLAAPSASVTPSARAHKRRSAPAEPELPWLEITAGYLWSYSGVGFHGMQSGLTASVAYSPQKDIFVGLRGSFSPFISVPLPTVGEISIARGNAQIGLSYAPLSQKDWALCGRLWTGFAFFKRSTISVVNGDPLPASPWYIEWLLEPEIAVAYRPTILHTRFGLVASAGVQFVPRAPIIEYRLDGAAQPAFSYLEVEPTVRIELLSDLF